MTIQEAKALIGLCIDEGLKQGVLKSKGEFEELLDYLDMCFTDTNKMTNGSSEIPKELKEAGEKEYPCDKSWMTDSMLDMNAHCQVAFWKGAKWDREQMMKEAMQMYRCYDEEHNLVGFSVDYDAPGAYGNYVNIIVKEDSHE